MVKKEKNIIISLIILIIILISAIVYVFVVNFKKNNNDTLSMSETIDSNVKVLDKSIYNIGYKFEGGLLSVYDKEGKEGAIDTNGDIVIDIQYDYIIYQELDGYFKVGKDGKHGLLDKNGNMIIDVKYEDVRPYHNGLAYVKENNVWKSINEKGESIATFPYEFIFPPEIYFNSASMRNIKNKSLIDEMYQSEMILVRTNDKKYGYATKEGNLVIDTKFDDAYPFCEGLACVRLDGKYGYIDTSGNAVIDFQFDVALPFYNGRTLVGVYENHSNWLIDKNGNDVLKFQNNISIQSVMNNECMILTKVLDDDDKTKYGLIDKNGNVLIDFIYDYIGDASENCIVVGMDTKEKQITNSISDGEIRPRMLKYGYTDLQGNIISDIQFDEVSQFSEGLACVKKDDKYGYLDTNGNIVIDFQYDNAFNFSGGLAVIKKFSAEENKFIEGCIDKKGNIKFKLD